MSKQKKRWYDYLWIASLTYLVLGFFNILFAWLGLICFLVPLIISIAKGTKDIVTATADGDNFSASWVDASDYHGKRIFLGG
jgi:hypothetical protein